MIDFERIRGASAARAPFPHFVAENVIGADDLAAIGRDFPPIESTGVFPLAELDYGPAFERLIFEINSPRLEEIIEDKLGLSLAGRPLMITVRGHCHRKDGRIHTDSTDKIATCLLYLNEANWNADGGRLRLLRNGYDLDDTITEVSPVGGTLVAFKRTDNSWHGHAPFEGPRRYVMFNWVTSELTRAKNLGRHRVSARIKRLLPSF